MGRSLGALHRHVWAVTTLVLIVASSLVVVAAPFAADESTLGVYPALGFAAFLIWTLVIAVVWSLRPFRVRVAGWTAWFAGGVTLALTLGPIPQNSPPERFAFEARLSDTNSRCHTR